MNSFDIISVRNEQRLFFIEMKALVVGLQELPEETLFLEKKEELGIWIDSLSKENQIDKNEALKIRNAFENSNQSSIKIYQLVNQGKRKEAKEALKLFEKRSKIMLTLLDNLSEKYKNEQ